MEDEIIIGKDGREINIGNLEPKTKEFYYKLRKKLKEHFNLELNDYITSAYRTEEENTKIGAKGKRHVTGEAIDIGTQGTGEAATIIKNYIWSTDEGLSLLEEAGLGLYDKNHGTGPHIHLGKDISKDPENGVMHVKQRRNYLKQQDAEGNTTDMLMSVNEIKQSLSSYVDPKVVQQDLINSKLTEKEKQIRNQSVELSQKNNTFLKAKQAYQEAKATGLKSKIRETEEAYNDAAYDLYYSTKVLEHDAKTERYNTLKSEIPLYEEGSPQYLERMTEFKALESDLYVKSGGKIYPKKIGGLSNKNNKEHFLDIRTGKKKISMPTLDQMNEVKDEAIAQNYTSLQVTMSKLSGDIDFSKPEYQEELNTAIQERQLERNSAIQKQAAIIDAETEFEKEQVKANQELEEQAKRAKEAEIEKANQEKQDALVKADGVRKMDQQAEDYFSRFTEPKEVIAPENFVYNDKDYKKQLPWEALGYGALAIAGLSDAKKELPLREDDLSEVTYQYIRDLKMLSEQGLKPEEEAMFKDQLSSMYAEGMDQLVRASGGNRNLVLGNMGGLKNSQMRALTEMKIADINIKQQNFEKYGEMIKMLQDFRTKKNIDNYTVKLQDTSEKRQAGAQLASSGFAQMLEELQYQKENGPGSVNHRFMKTMEVMMTGIDSDRENKADGSNPFTANWQQKNKAAAIDKYNQSLTQYNDAKSLLDGWNSLEDSEKARYLDQGGFQGYINSLKPKEPQITQAPEVKSGFMSMFGGY